MSRRQDLAAQLTALDVADDRHGTHAQNGGRLAGGEVVALARILRHDQKTRESLALCQ